ncbi:MAG: DUF4124 domain-containing protein [Deltaproteobacteria bacterium]|nr:DUF4124 domain-containing protein [Deltaproteobacteria bacterium]
MHILLLILLLTLRSFPVAAEEIYKWEDDKGVIHYGDRLQKPGAQPFSKEKAPYSNLKEGQEEPAREPKVDAVDDNPKPRGARRSGLSTARPSPSLKGAKAWIDWPRKDFWFSGVIRNGGKGICETPGAEITIIDELGSVDGKFELTAKPGDLGRGGEAELSGKYFSPIGDTLSWEATPRCSGLTGVFQGASKRGKLKIPRSRTVGPKRSRTK